ncbi:MAG: ABC transporter ATP-binding protein [Bacillota bacterium]|jgi:ATP-binding cassette subfamily B protein AbcA/BmrA
MRNRSESRRDSGPAIERISFRQFLGIFSGVKLPWVLMLLMLVSSLYSYFFMVRVAHISGDIVDASGNIPDAELWAYATSMTLICLIGVVNSLLDGFTNEKIALGLRDKLWKKIIYMPLRYYGRDGGESLVSRITSDCNFAAAVFTTLIGVVTQIFGQYTYIKNMYGTSAQLSNYMLLLLVPISLVAGWLFGRARYIVSQRTQATLADSTAYLIERTRNLRLIKAANAQALEAELGREKFAVQYSVQLKTGIVTAMWSVIDRGLALAGMAIAFIFGSILVARGELTTGTVITFYGLSGTITMRFAGFIATFGSIREAIGALARVTRTLELPDEDVKSGIDLDIPDADIRLENVRFAYEDRPVLDGFDCVIPRNRTTAVIGANGSGKTTLFRLLARHYEPDAGIMYFGDTAATEFNLHAWRRAFGLVAQDRPILEGTIRENITYGCLREVSDEELLQVAKMARVYDFVKDLPDGFDSYVAPGGQNFSGGQRQCIAIARAIMYNPDYLLLDEATSNLDARNERMVTDALQNLMAGRTTVIIAHSLSAIRNADHVIIIKDGRVASYGSPEDVFKASEEYRDFVMSQRPADQPA